MVYADVVVLLWFFFGRGVFSLRVLTIIVLTSHVCCPYPLTWRFSFHPLLAHLVYILVQSLEVFVYIALSRVFLGEIVSGDV